MAVHLPHALQQKSDTLDEISTAIAQTKEEILNDLLMAREAEVQELYRLMHINADEMLST